VSARILGVVAAALLVSGALGPAWLVDFGDQFGLLRMRLGDGHEFRDWIWNTRLIEVETEHVGQVIAHVVAGIATFAACLVAALALVVAAMRDARWLRWLSLVAVVVAAGGAVVFDLANLLHGGFGWSQLVFALGACATIVRFLTVQRK
jgi:uncharacterized membrane protein YhaH (DUF805 family)